MFRLISLCAVLCITSSCGTIQNRESGLVETSKLVIRSETLIGATITVGDDLSLTVLKENLTPYESGIFGVKDRANEMLETVVLQVTEGNQRITVRDGGYALFDKELYIGKGQTRELRIKK